MTIKDALGERMKGYELEARTTLPERSYTLVRLDGRAFHTYLKGAHKPFDMGFVLDMGLVTQFLAREVGGTVFGYTQSDEISLLLQDFKTESTQPWFGGEVQKIVSTSAALATAMLNELRPGKLATFDSRVFTLPSKTEVANYFLWRQKDAIRNSVSMAAQAVFSHADLHGKSQTDMLQMLEERGVFWEKYNERVRRGTVVSSLLVSRPFTYTRRDTGETITEFGERRIWHPTAAPEFSATEGWLTDQIPEL